MSIPVTEMNVYNFYAAGDAPNYFGGAIALGGGIALLDKVSSTQLIANLRIPEGATNAVYQ